MLTLGIDPGNSGAIAIVETLPDRPPVLLHVEDMPTYMRTVGQTRRPAIDPIRLHAVIMLAKHMGVECYAVELVNGHNQGATSAFSFGRGNGIIDAAFAFADCDPTFIEPGIWKKATATPTDKTMAIVHARKVFAGEDAAWFGDRDTPKDGRAEAALLAFWAAKFGLNYEPKPRKPKKRKAKNVKEALQDTRTEIHGAAEPARNPRSRRRAGTAGK